MKKDEVIKSLKEWANPDPLEMSGPQWKERMLGLVDIIKEICPVIDSVKHWDINIGNELNDKGKNLMEQALKLANQNPLLPPDDFNYSERVTDLRSETSNFADRLQHLDF